MIHFFPISAISEARPASATLSSNYSGNFLAVAWDVDACKIATFARNSQSLFESYRHCQRLSVIQALRSIGPDQDTLRTPVRTVGVDRNR